MFKSYERVDPSGPLKTKVDRDNELVAPYFTCPENGSMEVSAQCLFFTEITNNCLLHKIQCSAVATAVVCTLLYFGKSQLANYELANKDHKESAVANLRLVAKRSIAVTFFTVNTVSDFLLFLNLSTFVLLFYISTAISASQLFKEKFSSFEINYSIYLLFSSFIVEE